MVEATVKEERSDYTENRIKDTEDGVEITVMCTVVYIKQ